MLDLIWHEAGAEALLSVGQEIRSVGYDPIWHSAIRSESPAFLFDKWRRIEAFSHSQNRVRIDQTSDKCFSFSRYTVDGGTPTAPENLLVCGVIIALLEQIGCLDLRCEMPLEGGKVFCVREGGRFFTPDDPTALMTGSWVIEWHHFTPRVQETVPWAESTDLALPPIADPTLATMIETMVRLLARDVTRQWKVTELAYAMALSTRSLQRRLRDADLSFSQLVRLVRIHEACGLLKNSDTQVTAIGYCAGFSDSAHFSRDFRASMGLTPTEYRNGLGTKKTDVTGVFTKAV